MADLFDVLCAADTADLYYVNDEVPGISRRRCGRGFSYRHPDGSKVSASERRRIESLVIPPAWDHVWICPIADGHLQATGRDQRGRKQFLYHPEFRKVRELMKYEQLAEFGRRLPKVREQIEADLGRRGLPQEKVLAAVVRLLDDTLIRVGNDEYAATNESFGLTTFQQHHADVDGGKVRFEFRGKSGIEQEVELRDPRLARIVKACQELPGEELFQYVDDDDAVVDVSSGMVNDYLRDVCGGKVTAKHFRTWGGTVVAAEALAELPVPDAESEAKSNELAAIDLAAERLGNTRSVCRSSYVHPRLFDAYREGGLQEAWKRARQARHFSRAERATLTVLEQASADVAA
jgi:DNA topoisomerase I